MLLVEREKRLPNLFTCVKAHKNKACLWSFDRSHAVLGVVEAGAVPVEAPVFLEEVAVLPLSDDGTVLA